MAVSYWQLHKASRPESRAWKDLCAFGVWRLDTVDKVKTVEVMVDLISRKVTLALLMPSYGTV
jgi:hypothetical protein